MLFVLLLFVLLGKCRGSVITINSIECIEGKTLCPNKTCAITMTQDNQYFANVGCYLPYPMYNMTADARIQRKKGTRYETMFSAKENMCEVVTHMTKSQIMARVFANVDKYVKNFKCPFQGNMTANNLPLVLSFVPGFMPKSLYRVFVDIRNNNEPILVINLIFTIGKQNKVRKS